MRRLRRFGPALMLGLMIAVAGVSFAQNTAPTTGDEKHACCCTASGGDSCQMMKKDGAKNHATSADKESCCGDSCQMMKKDSAKTGTTTATATGASDKHECCCCGDSCDMKHNKHANMKGKS